MPPKPSRDPASSRWSAGDYSESQISAIAETLSEAGVTALEVTLNSAGALRHLELIQLRFPQLLTGVMTVLTAAETSQALAKGAHFFVSPNSDPASIALSKEAGVLQKNSLLPSTYRLRSQFHGATRLG